MDFAPQELEYLVKRIRELKSKIRSLEIENKKLKEENVLLKSEAESLQRQLKSQLEQKAGDLFAAEFVGRFRTRDEARKKVNQLLATVDKILAKLKYGQ